MLTPAEFINAFYDIGERKAAMPVRKMLLLGILAGFYIGVGALATNTAAHAIDNVSAAKVLSGLLFPFGLIMIIMTGAELFTGNCLLIMPLSEKRISLGGMLRNLVTVYIANAVGAVLLAYACFACGQLKLSDGALAVYAIRIASAKCSLGFGTALVLGILCNILVCVAVMMSLSSKSVAGRVLGAYVPIAFFVICGFEHSIANMCYIPMGLFAASDPGFAAMAVEAGINLNALTWGNFLFGNLLPVTIGNIIGGMGFGAAIRLANR